MSILPEVNHTVLTDHESSASNNNDTPIGLESTKSISYSVVNATSNALLPDTNITSITVSSLNPSLVTLQDAYGNSGDTLSVVNKNRFSINVLSNTISGLVPLKVDATFFDSNNQEQNLSEIFELVVLSGAPTAMSLSYAGTEQNTTKAKFIENWVLTVTDKYNNVVNSQPSISMGALTSYTQSSAATGNVANYLYFNPSAGSGTLSDADPDTFTSSNNAFDNVDLINDKLVLFGGDGYRFDAFGKWDINNINASNELELVDDYNGSGVSDLGFAVGRNFRNEVCSGNPVVANVYAKDGNNILDATGSMIIQIEYDYYLVGKDIVLWTNLVGSSNNSDVKMGLSRKVTLRGQGLDAQSYTYAAGFSGTVRLNISITNTVEYYKNANFDYLVEVTGIGTDWTEQGSSMSDGDITNCVLNNGVGYVDVNIISSVDDGVIRLTNVLPSSEF